MRRLICFVMLCVLLTSCSLSSAKPISSGFRCRLETEYDGIKVAATLDRTDPTETLVTFREPKELSGFEAVCTENDCQLRFLGMTFDVPSSYASSCALLYMVVDVLDRYEAGETDERLRFDEQTGFPLLLEHPQLNLTVRFSEWETAS